MNPNVVSIRPDATIEDALALLLAHEVSGLPVTDAEGRLLGMITEFALLAIAYDPSIREDRVEDHMTKEVLAVEEDEPIRRVADLCIVHRVRRVPVVRQGMLMGLISRRDVLRAVCLECGLGAESGNSNSASRAGAMGV